MVPILLEDQVDQVAVLAVVVLLQARVVLELQVKVMQAARVTLITPLSAMAVVVVVLAKRVKMRIHLTLVIMPAQAATEYNQVLQAQPFTTQVVVAVDRVRQVVPAQVD
jgi:hypothetical protein